MSEYFENMTTGKKVKLALAVIAVIFVFTFAVVNWQDAIVNFVFFTLKTSITLLIIVCFCIGYLVSSIFDFKPSKEKDEEIARLKAEVARLEILQANNEREDTIVNDITQ